LGAEFPSLRPQTSAVSQGVHSLVVVAEVPQPRGSWEKYHHLDRAGRALPTIGEIVF